MQYIHQTQSYTSAFSEDRNMLTKAMLVTQRDVAFQAS